MVAEIHTLFDRLAKERITTDNTSTIRAASNPPISLMES